MAEAGLAMEPIPLEERTTLSAKVMSTPAVILSALSLSPSLSPSLPPSLPPLLVACATLHLPSETACLAGLSCYRAAAHGLS